jgi:hypothetical protein
MAFTYRLEKEDGKPADPPILHHASDPSALSSRISGNTTRAAYRCPPLGVVLHSLGAAHRSYAAPNSRFTLASLAACEPSIKTSVTPTLS